MTPEHPRWDEFVERLVDALDFSEDGRRWRCDTTHAHSVAILREMGFDDEEIADALDGFEAQCGHCDCEVIFNIEGPRVVQR